MSHAPDQPTVDGLLDRAVRAINEGDRDKANELAEQVLEYDQDNEEAEELLTAPTQHAELRRLSLLFVDLVDSTRLSTSVEPETYRLVVGRFRDDVVRIVARYEGYIEETKGDGLLALFGHPRPHEDDVRRAVQTGLDITREVARLSSHVRRRFGLEISVRVGVHRGLVYLDTRRGEVYGFAVNLAARICSIADPGSVAASAIVAQLAGAAYEFEAGEPREAKGVDGPIVPYRVIAERDSVNVPVGLLIGRDDEVALLTERWRDAGRAAGQLPGLGFHGEPGIGKSRLARAAGDLAERDGAVPVDLFGSPLHTEVGLHPFRRLLERRCGIRSDTESHERLHRLRTELRSLSVDEDHLVPLLAPVLGIAAKVGYLPVSADGAKLQQQIAQALCDYVFACTRADRALVIAEDMQWFDAASADIVRSLLDGAHPGLLVVMTSRSPAEFEGCNAEIHEVRALSGAASHRLISVLHPEISSSGLDIVSDRCAGIPLYIEEVVAKLKNDTAADSTQVPDTLYEALFARLRSSDNAVELAQAAATIGRRFDRSTLIAVLDMPDDEIDDTLAELVGGRVIEPIGTSHWSFRHELLREVAAELPPPTIRQRLHGRVADALRSISAQSDPDWPVIADHYTAAHRIDEAVAAYQEASTVARQRGALDEAVRYLTHALDQLQQNPAAGGRDRHEMRLRLDRGFLTSAIEGPGSVATTSDFERCLELGSTDPRADEMFWTLQSLFTYYVSRADLQRAQQIVETLRLGLGGGREWCRVEVVGGDTILSFLRGEFGDAHRHMTEALQLMTARAKPDFDAWFVPYDAIMLDYTNLAHTRWVLGDLTGAEEAFAHSDDRIAELPIPQGPYSACYARWVQTWMYLESNQLERAAGTATDLLQIGTTHGFDQWALLGGILLSTTTALAALADNDVDAPEIAVSIAGLLGWASVGRMVGANGWLTWFDGLAARVLIAAGELEQARDQLGLGLGLAAETGMCFYNAEMIRLRAATHPDADAKRADLIASYELASRQGSPVFALRAAIDVYRLGASTDRRLLDQAIAQFPADSSWPELVSARAL